MPPRSILNLFLALICTIASAADRVEVSVTPSMREYCHIIAFPQGWIVPPHLSPRDFPNSYAYNSEYEFRIPGLLETRYLIAGRIAPSEQYTVNKYEVDLSDPKAPVLAVSEGAWQQAIPVPLTRKPAVPFDPKPNKPLEFNGFQFAKIGEVWNQSRLSPDRVWIVVQSWSGRADYSGNVFTTACFPFGCRGKLFFDVFSADTGKRIVTVQGAYFSANPGGMIQKTGWVTERYFIVPLGEHRERCLVCEFGQGKGGKP